MFEAHEELEHDVAALAVGSGEPDDLDRIRTHVDGCVACQQLYERLSRTAGQLALSAELATPPPRLRTRIVEAALKSRQVIEPAPTRLRVVPRRSLLSPSPRLPRAWATAAAATMLIVLASFGAGFVTGHRSSGSVVSPAPATVQYRLTGSGSMSGASGQAIVLPDNSLTLVNFQGLPQLASNRVYEVWLIPNEGAPIPADVFSPEADGSKVILITRRLTGFKAIAVTVEPGPTGSPQPTQQPELSGSVA